jgi:adenylosuccinate lyase
MNSILLERYVSPEMAHIFSRESRYGKWRLVWLALAEAQAELGFPISKEKLEKVRETADQIDFARVKEIETKTRHDVMAHLKHWAEICPEVNTTIHIGATSCYVTDNAECVLHKEALHFIIGQIKELNKELKFQAYLTAGTPALGYTHFQPASPTTIGKRITMWMQDLINDYDELVTFHDNMLCRGAKGTTGTQASYLELADNDETKVRQLDRLVARKLKFKNSVELSGQTISRKQDVRIGDLLSGLAISLSKMGHDIRLLSHTGDLREGFADGQVGSSAMPYKRNPMLAERLCALTRLVPQSNSDDPMAREVPRRQRN